MEIKDAYRIIGEFNIDNILDCLQDAPESAWREQDIRQRTYDVHHQTESIIMLFCDNAWPDVTVSRQAGWDRIAPVCAPVMEAIIAQAYAPGGRVLRAMAAKLLAGGRIAPHIDALPSFRAAHRVHLPLVTNPGVRFTVDGRPCPMVPGQACEINNQRVHSVINRGDTDRISFIFDYMPPAEA